MEILEQLAGSLRSGDVKKTAEATQLAIGKGLEPRIILDDGLIAGMSIVGEQFKHHEIFLPEVLLAAKAMYAGMDLLKPLLIRDGVKTIGKVVIGTVQGDLHDIGKNLVAIMLKGAGFEVIDLGNDVSPQQFIETAEKEHAERHRDVGAADNDNAGHEKGRRAGKGTSAVWKNQDHCGRRSVVDGICPGNRSGFVLFRRCQRR